jgi:ABC-2 type transport system ATP-binding protein
MSTHPTFAIYTRKLTRQFGSIQAVNQLSMRVPPGIIFGFLGPNGAGKTTTIRMLLGLVAPTSGAAEVLGFDVETQADLIRAQTGTLLEHNGIYERLSAEDNLDFYARIFLMPAVERERRIEELLSSMGLWDRRKELAGKWSKGMKQRLALARALLHKPRLLFLDEPTAGLDVVSAAEIRQTLQQLVETENITVFLNSHNMSEVEQICHHVTVIKNGNIIAEGRPQELSLRNKVKKIIIEGSGFSTELTTMISTLPEILLLNDRAGRLVMELSDEMDSSFVVNMLVKNGAKVNEVRHERESLENVFIRLMEEENV